MNGQAQTLDSLGYIDHHSGRHDDAIEHYRQAISLYRDLDNTYETADTLDRLGHSHAALGRHDHTRAAWRKHGSCIDSRDGTRKPSRWNDSSTSSTASANIPTRTSVGRSGRQRERHSAARDDPRNRSYMNGS